MNVSDQKILQLWRDPSFAGSYRGIKTFQLLLKTDLNIDISEKRLSNILKNDSIFLIHQRPKRKIVRRSYDIRFYGELVQADIAYMFEFNDYKYFLLLVDCFSLKLFVQPLKSKTSEAVQAAIQDILKEFGAPIEKLETDQGKEFLGCKKFFKKEKNFFKAKFGKNKANFAEWGIMVIKKRLYKMLRGNLTHNWVNYIKKIATDYNETPLKKLGWMKPNSIHSQFDSVLVEEAQRSAKVTPYREPDIETRKINEENYLKNSKNLQVGTYVYLDFNESLFGKSFDVQVRRFLPSSFIQFF
jgi:hypothetical protein